MLPEFIHFWISITMRGSKNPPSVLLLRSSGIYNPPPIHYIDYNPHQLYLAFLLQSPTYPLRPAPQPPCGAPGNTTRDRTDEWSAVPIADFYLFSFAQVPCCRGVHQSCTDATRKLVYLMTAVSTPVLQKKKIFKFTNRFSLSNPTSAQKNDVE